jgi:hypothetical protein
MAEQQTAFWKDVTKLDRASLEAAVETYRSALESIIDLMCDWNPDPTPGKAVSDQE